MILIKYPTINNTYYPTYFKFLLFTGILKCYSIVNNYVILLVLRGKHTPTILTYAFKCLIILSFILRIFIVCIFISCLMITYESETLITCSLFIAILTVMNCDVRGRWSEDLGLIHGELWLRATVPAALQYPRVLFTIRIVAAARVGGAQGTPAAGLRPRPTREKGFPSNLLLD
jgi:hypothetical protein